MRRFAFALLLGCSAATPIAGSPTTPDAWTARCAARLDLAQRKVGLAGGTKVDRSPWNPSVRFEAHVGAGYYEASVSHGEDACSDFDSDDPSLVNLQWSDGASSKKTALDRIRRMNRDEGAIQADAVGRETIEPFRAAFEEAIEACLVDARAVPIGKVPSDFSCMDKTDRCPDSPSAADEADGCPSPKSR